jgi:hypothetical protein
MLKKTTILIGAIALCSSALAQVGVDGSYGSEWSGVSSVHVTHDDNAPEGNFQSPGPTNKGAGYDVYLRSDSTYMYGLINGTDNLEASPGSFANLYFDLDPQNGNGSDWGMETTNNRSFVPGQNGYYDLTGNLTFATTASSVEFALKWSYLMDGSNPDVTFYGAGPVAPGGKVTLRLSQSLGYSVAGGASYGPDRLGSVFAPVPEPASMSILGLGVLGLIRRRRSVK